MGRLRGFWGRLRAILAVLGLPLGDSRPSWAVFEASRGTTGPSWGPLGPEKNTQHYFPEQKGHAGSPGRFGN